jgi:exodeoxyribonuclease VII small subunit
MTSKKKDMSEGFNFEKSLSELEQLVSTMEGGELTLEESLKQFESGIKLIRGCQTALTDAEQKVEILTKDGLKPFSE